MVEELKWSMCSIEVDRGLTNNKKRQIKEDECNNTIGNNTSLESS